MVAVAAILGVACGGGSATPGSTAVSIGATNYQTLPPAASTIPPQTTAANAAGSVTQFETEYTVQAGDLPSTIANTWKIPLQALLDANGWVLEGQFVPAFPPAGTVIKIPAGATVPGAPVDGGVAPAVPETGTATTVAPTTVAPTTTAAPTESCGTYTILAGDTSRIKVAQQFNTTVDKLDAANVATKGYSGFYPGLVIQLPC